MFFQTFLLPQVKRMVIVSNKHGIYKWPYKLPNDLPHGIFTAGGGGKKKKRKKKILDLRRLGNIEKISKLPRIIVSCSVLLTK